MRGSQWLFISTDFTDVTLVSEDTYGGKDKDDEDDDV